MNKMQTNEVSGFDNERFVDVYVLCGGTREEAEEFLSIAHSTKESDPKSCDDVELVESYRKLDKDNQAKIERVVKTLLLLQQTV